MNMFYWCILLLHCYSGIAFLVTIDYTIISNIDAIQKMKPYVPIKLCKVTGSIHFFKLAGRLQKENITTCRNMVWDILEIDWNDVTIMAIGNVVNLPGSVMIPFPHKFKIRQMIGSKPLLLHLMLKQGQTWYPLSNVCEMMEIEAEENNPESIEMQIGS